ncbi:hypothetical protein [Paenibacillus oceani]|uniref:DUF4179 domain-containing protein n=1 Tax=Paenibacillus oceani TaxID=2772510 RepID=A0A927C9S8_9BACL|nr:hypothetical protein [Paenibacillus oceani]MBD2862341.1 hypothetical protein [Paenibacillus oceani]
MSDPTKWDRMFKQALASTEEPGDSLNESIIHLYKERTAMKRGYRKRISAGVLAAVFTIVISITAIAATQLFSSKQVAERLGQQLLAKAFESADAIEINQSAAAGDYTFTLHGIVSGAGLTEFNSTSQRLNPDRTYAVVSIARQDGGPMPAATDPEYGQVPFFISPLIKGQKPWQVNIVTMNGGYSEVVIDGTMYRLIECDGVEMFADRGVYLAIISGSTFYSNEAFAYEESTGEIRPRADFQGSSILFDLPLNKAKADPAKAEAYLQKLLKEPHSAGDASGRAAPADEAGAEHAYRLEQWKKKMPEGTVVPESVKAATIDQKGYIHYDHDGWRVTLAPGILFEEGQTGFSDSVQFSGSEDTYKAMQFHKDEQGVITGRIINLN